jgi:hypothetical protein
VNSPHSCHKHFLEMEDAAEAGADEQIEDYLDYLCAPLIGSVPYRRRLRFRMEVQAHIDGLIMQYQAQGQAPSEAVQTALRELGEPGQAGQDFLQEWLEGAPHAGAKSVVRATILRAFAMFGVATVLNLFAIQLSTDGPRNISDPSPSLLTLAALSPLIAGCLTGLARPARIKAGTIFAILLCVVASTAVGLVMLPQTEGLIFALFQLLFWLPAGCLSALGTASLVRQHRRLRFWGVARRANG